MKKVALALEGGSLRSLFTSGVLDTFMESGITFPCVVGVSAGALNGANFVAGHIGRTARINIMHSEDANYFGMKQLLLKRSAFNFDYIFDEPINDLYPFNEGALKNPEQRFLICATDCATGEPVYFEKDNYADMARALQASSSMPLLSKTTDVDGITCLDGAISDPFGMKKAMEEGYEKIVVVLTRHRGYRRKAPTKPTERLLRLYYGKYPELMAKLSTMSSRYNALLDEINLLEHDGKIFVIRPSRDISISRIEKDARKLTDLYLQGREDTRLLLPQMHEYMG